MGLAMTDKKIASDLFDECIRLREENERLTDLLNTPHNDDWFEGVRIEAAHQVERWGADHDAGKGPLDWFWLIGYLGQKAAAAELAGDLNKAKHHTISTAAALLNWHRKLSGADNRMRPGIDPVARGFESPQS